MAKIGDSLVCTFRKLVDKYAPLKTKILRGNKAPSMTRELKKGIYTRSMLKKRFNKHRTKESELKFERQRNNRVLLRENEEVIKQLF